MMYPWNDSDLTFIDGFCGAGGSSLGCEVAGARVKLAMNHNEHSLATHAYNFPHAAHAKVDISKENPKKYPHATMAWFSPECTCHSTSKGIKLTNQCQPTLPLVAWTDREEDPFIERSRATMWDVYRWSSAKVEQNHPFQLVFVENIPKVHLWKDYQPWLRAMRTLGYDYREVYFNSMFAEPFPCAVPQSRNRCYIVFWRTGNPAPDLDFHPPALCLHCGQKVQAIQRWKHPARKRGDYKKQYIYACPRCASEVTPAYTPAATMIDWSLPLVTIGARKKKLKTRTLERIEKGLARFCQEQEQIPFLVETCRTGTEGNFARPITTASFTQTQAQSVGVVVPHGNERAFLMSYYGAAAGYRALTDVVGTCTAKDRHALVFPPTTSSRAEVEACGFRMLALPEVKKTMGFPDTYTIVCTSQKEGVRQCGLAVTPAAAAALMQRGIASLGYQSPRKENIS